MEPRVPYQHRFWDVLSKLFKAFPTLLALGKCFMFKELGASYLVKFKELFWRELFWSSSKTWVSGSLGTCS